MSQFYIENFPVTIYRSCNLLVPKSSANGFFSNGESSNMATPVISQNYQETNFSIDSSFTRSFSSNHLGLSFNNFLYITFNGLPKLDEGGIYRYYFKYSMKTEFNFPSTNPNPNTKIQTLVKRLQKNDYPEDIYREDIDEIGQTTTYYSNLPNMEAELNIFKGMTLFLGRVALSPVLGCNYIKSELSFESLALESVYNT